MTGSTYGRIPKKYKVPGAKSVLKAIDQGLVAQILVAQDADLRVVAGVLEKAKERNIKVEWVPTMKELGEFCGINVGASCCAILTQEKGG